MLAAIPSAARSDSRSLNVTIPLPAEEDRLCAGCSRSVSSETGGVVVAFGDSLWHVECFKCAKCGTQVNADTNLLLLSDGSPVCANCYNCKVCGLPILDEAVMTGDDSYHAACFTCRSCKCRIDELVFAKTSQGFYCMKCHNERVARSRRHIARQKQKEKERQLAVNSYSRANGAPRTDEMGVLESSQMYNDSLGAQSSRSHHPSESPSNSRISPYASQNRSRKDSYNNSQRLSDPNSSFADMSYMSTNSAQNASVLSMKHEQAAPERRSTSPVPPTLSIVNADGGHSSRLNQHDGSHLNSPSSRYPSRSGSLPQSYDRPPPYTSEGAPINGNRAAQTTRGSGSDHYNNSSGPVSPSLSQDASLDHSGSSRFSDPSSSVHLNASYSESDSELAYADARRVEQERVSAQRRYYEGGNRRTSTLLAPQSPREASSPARNRRDKRGSINPGLQLEASKYLQFQSDTTIVPTSSQPNSPTIAISAPPQQRTSPTSPSTGESLATSLAKRSLGTDSDSTHLNGRVSPTNDQNTFHSSASSPQHKASSSNLLPAPSPSPSTSTISAPSPREMLSRIPNRSDSLRGIGSQEAAQSAMRIVESTNGRLQPSPPTHVLRQQRSFDERSGRLSPGRSDHSHDSKRSRSVSPKAPDVPRSIESGTDTEADSGGDGDLDEITLSYALGTPRERDSAPPPPPPKDVQEKEVEPNEETRRGHHTEPSVQSVATSVASNSTVSEGDDIDVGKSRADAGLPGSTTEKRTSAFFMAPALPPMRFSMNGSDFREILSSLGDDAPKGSSELVATLSPIKEDKSVNSASSARDNKPDGDVTQQAVSPSSLTTSPLRSPSEDNDDGLIKDSAADGKPYQPNGYDSRPSSTSRSASSEPSSQVFSRPSQDSKSPLSPRSSFGQPLSPQSPGAASHEKPTSSIAVHINGEVETERPSFESTNNDARPSVSKNENAERVIRGLKDALLDASERNAEHLKLDKSFAEAILSTLEDQSSSIAELSKKIDGIKRTSQMVMDGLSTAQEEYEQLLAARKNAEEEVSRLKIALSGQTARLTMLASEERKAELQKQLSEELTENVTGLERHLSKLMVERDIVVAEMEELAAKQGTFPGELPPSSVTHSLTARLDGLKKQYERDLLPLSEEREALVREIAELKEIRNIFIEESAVLSARNEELAQLNAQYEHKVNTPNSALNKEKSLPAVQKSSFDTWRSRQAPAMANTLSSSTASSTTLYDEALEPRIPRAAKGDIGESPTVQPRSRGIGLRWPGNKANKENVATHSSTPSESKGKRRLEHMFQQISILRFSRCDYCGDKMWGSQARCTACNFSVHVRCAPLVQSICVQDSNKGQEPLNVEPPPPSMFGRDLVEQVRADSQALDKEREIPVIVEKCIDAVETWAMDYEGIYRKTGGSGQSKAITSLFERGDYDAFDLRDSDAFNDISSVTSVLKTYFRNLPNPLLTHELHESFVAAAGVRDPELKSKTLRELVQQLPKEHYHTLARLMLHLHRVQLQSEQNLMNARNLGVIFGPTLMRSADPNREFGDMAGKTLAIEWLIENAPSVFEE